MTNGESIAFFVPGLPTAQGRPRSFAIRKGGVPTGKIGHYTPKDSASWLTQIRDRALAAYSGPRLEGPLSVLITCLMPMPKSLPKRDVTAVRNGHTVPHMKKPDGDNLEAVIFNALKGVIWRDDAQVWHHTTRKIYGEPPGVSVVVYGSYR